MKYASIFLSFLLYWFLFHTSIRAETYIPIEDKAQLPILTPSFSDREVAKIRLSNGLEAYIISDPKAVKSAAALTVNVGSWSDPVEYPGIAHFLEHMLFLGTEKYPIESEYDQFIKEHNGDSNAYTSSDHSLYLFSVNNDAFEESLDRFSHFFKKPLFNPSGVSRELQAINQEFAKNFSEDSVREMYVHKELGNPNHPFHHFSTGNAATLSKVSQKTLRQWYQEHYSANLMHLIVYSPLPLSKLKKLVVSDFKDIPNTEKTPTKNTQPLLTETRTKQIVYIEPLKNIRGLRILWELPSAFAHMEETKPAHLICYALGHEGPGSLLEELKKENLAEGIECSGYYLGSDHYMMSLYVKLTEKGLQEVNPVIEKCFGAINGLKQQEEFPYYIFDEVKKIETLRYQYQSRQDPFDYLMDMGEWLIREKLETFPEQSLIIQRFDPKNISDLLNYLTPQNAAITVIAKPEASGVKSTKKETWMNVPYSIQSIPQEQILKWSEAQPEPSWHLPDPNPFIPQNISITSKDLVGKHVIPHPDTLVDSSDAKIYYAKDIDFQIPQTMWFFEIKTPAVKNQVPSDIVLANLYTKSLKESLNPYSYNARVADLDYEIERIDNGIGITLRGYQDNAELLFDAILERLKNYRPSKQLFEIYKESLLRRYQNFTQESPLRQGLETYQSIIYKYFSTHKQRAEAIKNITYEDFLEYSNHLFDRSYTLGLLYGNVEKEQALRIWTKLKSSLSSVPYLKEDQQLPEIIVLPQDQGPFLLKTSVDFAGNAVILSIEDPIFSFKTRAAQQILSKAMSGPFYADLRTKQQTAYIVYNSAEELEKHLFNFFAVQSNTHDPRDLLARFELFIEKFLQEMSKEELNEEKFEIIRKSLLINLEEPPQSLSEMGNLLKILAFKYEGDFDWISKRIQGFKELKYEDFLEIATQFLGKSNKRRLAILVEGQIPREQRFRYIPVRSVEKVRQLSQYSYEKLDEQTIKK